MFDGIRAKYEQTDHYLSPTASIVQLPSFESAICKLIEENEALTEEEEDSVSCFKILNSEEQVQGSFAEQILKKPRLKKYQNPRYIIQTMLRDSLVLVSLSFAILGSLCFPKI